MGTELTKTESTQLSECELIIDRNLAAFTEVGNALLKIRDERLYRATHKTFDDYCRDRWSMASRHANRLIDGAFVVCNLGPMGPTPTAERQVRPLTKLEPEKQTEAWAKAVESAGGKTPTAKQVEAAVDEISDDPDEETPRVVCAVGSGSVCLPSRAELEAEERLSPKVRDLQRNWRAASKRDRAAFIQWASEENPESFSNFNKT